MVTSGRETPARAVRGAHAASSGTEREHDMTRNVVRIALFGGALAAPGIAASEAHADTTFTPYAGGGNTVFLTAYAYDFDAGDDLFGGRRSSTTFDDYAVSGLGATIRGAVTPTQLISTIDATDWPTSLPESYLIARAQIRLEPLATDTEILAEWGGTESGAAAFGFLNNVRVLEGAIAQTVVFDTSTLGLNAGSATFTLEAGRDYVILVRSYYDLSSSDTNTFNRFATATIIPAPVSLAPLALGGLVAARRRRVGRGSVRGCG